jgi:predicted TIM-barrel fold metal-dependent hydrolase
MSQVDVPRFDAQPRTPQWRAPAGSVDCHIHVFGPAERYPWSPERGYTPPDALLEDYALVQERLGLERAVVVQPSVYGTDNRRTHDAVVQLGRNGRGVAVLPMDVEAAELARLHDAGFRATRLNLVSPGSASLDGIEALAEKIAVHGWHLVLHVAQQILHDHGARLAALPVELVFDHFGPLDFALGPDQPTMQELLGLLRGGRAWMKISCAYRIDHGPAPWPAASPFAELLLREVPDRLNWGTDWPHPGPPGPMPNDGDLLDGLWQWCRDEALYRQILADNPVRLYGFS